MCEIREMIYRLLLLLLIALISKQSFADARSDAISSYISKKNNKAWAVSTTNGYGYRAWNRATVDQAKNDALKRCRKYGRECRIHMINNTTVIPIPRQAKMPTKVTVYDAESNKKTKLNATTVFGDVFEKVSTIKIYSSSGTLLCSGLRRYLGKGRFLVEGNCLGARYKGRLNGRSKVIKGKIKNGRSWMEIVV